MSSFRFLSAFACAAVLATAAVAQKGTVVSVDAQKQQMVLSVADQNYTVDATKTELLDKDGKAAKLSDFAAKAKVKVAMDGERITSVRLVGAELFFAVAEEGSIVRVDADTQKIVVKVGAAEHTVLANKVTLLDKEGKAAKLSDFAAGAKVKVTFTGEAITTLQLQK